jgi:type VI secretion system protein ImpH
MATEIGTQAAGLDPAPEVETPIDHTAIGAELVDNACSFEFFQAVALLQRLRHQRRPVGDFSSPDDEVVRFRVNPRLGFPASEIQELEMEDDAPASMMVNFMGLTGPMGVLPHPYSELILERLRAKDRSFASFLDIFNHRAISLFYRAWQRSRFPATYGAGGRDFFTQYLHDLLGLGTSGLQDRQEIEDEALMHYIALIAMQSRSAAALEQVLADYFQVPVEIQQFTGSWYHLDTPTQCMMNGRDSVSSQVGTGAVVGDAVWDRQGSVRIRLGPLTMDRYNDFLPGASAYAALGAITRFFSNGCIDFELQLVLDAHEVPAIELDLNAKRPARLGWTSWAKTAPIHTNPDDAVLALRG